VLQQLDQCPVQLSAGAAAPLPPADLLAEAEELVRQVHTEVPALGDPGERLSDVRAQVERTGTYRHTATELQHGARLAWRNSARCIGRLYWRSLVVRDRREVTDAARMADECVEHLRVATNGGRVRPVVTVFPPARGSGTTS